MRGLLANTWATRSVTASTIGEVGEGDLVTAEQGRLAVEAEGGRRLLPCTGGNKSLSRSRR